MRGLRLTVRQAISPVIYASYWEGHWPVLFPYQVEWFY